MISMILGLGSFLVRGATFNLRAVGEPWEEIPCQTVVNGHLDHRCLYRQHLEALMEMCAQTVDRCSRRSHVGSARLLCRRKAAGRVLRSSWHAAHEWASHWAEKDFYEQERIRKPPTRCTGHTPGMATWSTRIDLSNAFLCANTQIICKFKRHHRGYWTNGAKAISCWLVATLGVALPEYVRDMESGGRGVRWHRWRPQNSFLRAVLGVGLLYRWAGDPPKVVRSLSRPSGPRSISTIQ